MSNLAYHQYAKLLSAMENPKRIEIMRVLSVSSSTVGGLIHMTGMSQANMSQHLQVLRREGVVVTKREGKQILYNLSHPNYIKILEHIHEVLADRKKVSPLKNHMRSALAPHMKDPVCGMRVPPKQAVFVETYKRTAYYFCASGCKKRFNKNPEHYV